MPHAPILLHESDLGADEAAAVRGVLAAGGGWRDEALTRAWEEVWEAAWQREALAFAEAGELLGVLKTLLGWKSGDDLALSPLLEPVWREALAQQWLMPRWLDVEPVTGQVRVGVGPLLTGHPCGLPCGPPDAPDGAFLLEEISHLPLPMGGAGWGTVQVAVLDGNTRPCAGGTALLMSRDADLMREARRLRQSPPSAAACALGLAQWRRLPEILEHRARLAQGYGALRAHGCFSLPPVPPEGRLWGRFLLTLESPARRQALQTFLEASAILVGSPVWWHPLPEAAALPGVAQHLGCTLALPLHGRLDAPSHKRILNRIHRWAERCRKTP